MNKIARFVVDYVSYVVKGGPKFYAWIAFLGALTLCWFYGEYLHATIGLEYTGLTSQAHDGLFLANFVFLVGVAAGAVTIVFPAYVYHHEGMHKVAVLGEMLAIAAVIMCMTFVVSHMGRPDRLWHMIPFIGIYNIPNSMLAWDTLVLSGYLVLNLICGFYYLYSKYAGIEMNKKIYMPLIFLSIVWALSIHTVTAFLLGTMPARPMWHHTVMPIRFISTAFAAGPSLIILTFLIVRKNTKFWIDDSAINLLSTIVTFCLGIGLFLTLSEVVTELYANTEHALGLQYLMFGVNGLNDLVPWFWCSLAANLIAFGMLLTPSIRKDYRLLPIACVLTFTGIWIEKGMGLLIPGFIPSPIGEFTQYFPTLTEAFATLGNWALGFLILTILLKGAVGVLLGEIKYVERVSTAGADAEAGKAAAALESV